MDIKKENISKAFNYVQKLALDSFEQAISETDSTPRPIGTLSRYGEQNFIFKIVDVILNNKINVRYSGGQIFTHEEIQQILVIVESGKNNPRWSGFDSKTSFLIRIPSKENSAINENIMKKLKLSIFGGVLQEGGEEIIIEPNMVDNVLDYDDPIRDIMKDVHRYMEKYIQQRAEILNLASDFF